MFTQDCNDSGDRRRVLVVANETLGSDRIWDVAHLEAGDGTQIVVVAPALNGRLAFWASDDDGARRAAGERLRRSLAALRRRGYDAEGIVGDADPVLAIEDALRVFPADEIVVATHPDPESNWLERRVVARARLRFPQPIHHVIVDAPLRALAA